MIHTLEFSVACDCCEAVQTVTALYLDDMDTEIRAVGWTVSESKGIGGAIHRCSICPEDKPTYFETLEGLERGND